MTLNESKGNMYEFITHTWNPIKGKCFHDCAYCYMKILQPSQPPIHLVENELSGVFPPNTFIFIDSAADLFAKDVSDEWISRVLDFCVSATAYQKENAKTHFLLQTKNPSRLLEYVKHPLFTNKQVVACTTLETNRHYPDIMNNAPTPIERAEAMEKIAGHGIQTYVTLEPIMDFDLEEFVELIKMCKPVQVNIGAESFRRINLPEPSKAVQLVDLILLLIPTTTVKIKKNLKGKELTKTMIMRIKERYSYEKEE